MTTHFSYHAIDESLLKLDILGHHDPGMLKALREMLGVLGIPEFGGNMARSVIRKLKPATVSQLIKIDGLLHGTDVYMDNAETLIDEGIARLDECIGPVTISCSTFWRMILTMTVPFASWRRCARGRGCPRYGRSGDIPDRDEVRERIIRYEEKDHLTYMMESEKEALYVVREMYARGISPAALNHHRDPRR